MDDNVLGSEKNPLFVKLDESTVKRLIEGITQAIFEKKTMPEPCVDVDTLCNLIDISASKLYKLSAQSKHNGFPIRRKGKALTFKVSEVEEWFKKSTSKNKSRRTD